MKRTSKLGTLWFLLFSALGDANAEIVVNEEGLVRYWEIAPERMGATMPPLAAAVPHEQDKHGGEVWLEYELKINARGEPEAFRFISIEPAEADPRPFQALLMFFRYRPALGVEPVPVKVVSKGRFWTPRSPSELR